MKVEDIIYKYEGEQLQILMYLHKLLIEEYGLLPKIKFKLPFYYGKSWICYLNPKKEGVELAFTRGNELSNVQGLLENKGRNQVSGITLLSIKMIDMTLLEEIIIEAITLDEQIPYASKRSPKPK